MYKKEFGWPLSLVLGRSLDFQNDRSVFVIHGSPLNHTWAYANEVLLAGPLGSLGTWGCVPERSTL